MSLDKKGKGNPNWAPGKSGNPHGRPIGAKSLKGILKVAATLADKKRHPVEELIRIADHAELHPLSGGHELSAKIWADLLKYCEPQKKAVECAPEKSSTPEESLENAEKLLAEMEQIGNGKSGTDTGTESSNSPSLVNGTTDLSSQTSTTPDLPGDQSK